MLTFRWDGDGSGWGLILVYEPEVEGVRHRLTTTALPMPVFPDDWMKRAPVAAEVGGRMLGMSIVSTMNGVMTRLEIVWVSESLLWSSKRYVSWTFNN